MKISIILVLVFLLVVESIHAEVVNNDVDRLVPGGPTPCLHCMRSPPKKIDKVTHDHDISAYDTVDETTRDNDENSIPKVKFSRKFPPH